MLMQEQMFFEHIPTPRLTLKIFRSASGQWSGQLFLADEEIASLGGCTNPKEITDAARASSLYPHKIEIAS